MTEFPFRWASLGEKSSSRIRASISRLTLWWEVASSRWYPFLGSVTEPPARKAPRRKEARQQSSSSTAKLMCRARAVRSEP